VQLCPEDVASGFLEGECLVGGEVLVKLSEYLETSVGGLSFHGVVPGVEQDLFAFFFFLRELLFKLFYLFGVGVCLEQLVNVCGCFLPLVVFDEFFDVGDDLVCSFGVGGVAVGVGLVSELVGELFVSRQMCDFVDDFVGGVEVFLLQFIEDGILE